MTRVLERRRREGPRGKYFGAQFEEGLRITSRRAVGMCRRSWAGWFSLVTACLSGRRNRAGAPHDSETRLLTRHETALFPLFARSSVRRMLPLRACVRTCRYMSVHIYAPLRLHHACTYSTHIRAAPPAPRAYVRSFVRYISARI